MWEERLKRRAPFYIRIRNRQFLMEPAKFAVMSLVLLVLPLGSCRIAEEDAAAEGADRVNGTKTVELKGAIVFVRCQLSFVSC